MSDKKDYVFICSKCNHYLYKEILDEEHNVSDINCPNCGEEGYENWIFSGFGKFELDFPEYQ